LAKALAFICGAERADVTGLRLARVVELPPYHYGAIFEKPAAEPSGNDGE
jgi:hypothetical protein